MTDHTIVEHRPPLKRIDFAPKMRATPPDPYAGYEVDRTAEIAEQDRVWAIIRQCAEGCNPRGNDADRSARQHFGEFAAEGCNQLEATAAPSVYRDDTSLWQAMIDEAGR